MEVTSLQHNLLSYRKSRKQQGKQNFPAVRTFILFGRSNLPYTTDEQFYLLLLTDMNRPE